MPIITQFGKHEEVIPWSYYPKTKEWRPKTPKAKKAEPKTPHNGNFAKHQINLMKVSPIYKEIVLSKHNGKLLPNGDIRVGSDMGWNQKTGKIYKL